MSSQQSTNKGVPQGSGAGQQQQSSLSSARDDMIRKRALMELDKKATAKSGGSSSVGGQGDSKSSAVAPPGASGSQLGPASSAKHGSISSKNRANSTAGSAASSFGARLAGVGAPPLGPPPLPPPPPPQQPQSLSSTGLPRGGLVSTSSGMSTGTAGGALLSGGAVSSQPQQRSSSFSSGASGKSAANARASTSAVSGSVASLKLSPAISVKSSDSVYHASTLMAARHCDALLVQEAESEEGMAICGIITDKDITYRCIAAALDPNITKVSEIMTREVVVAAEDDTARQALDIMLESKFRHLPVVEHTDNGAILGVLDITSCLYDALDRIDSLTGTAKLLCEATSKAQNTSLDQPPAITSFLSTLQSLQSQLLDPCVSTIMAAPVAASSINTGDMPTAAPAVPILYGRETSVLKAAMMMRKLRATAAIIVEDVPKAASNAAATSTAGLQAGASVGQSIMGIFTTKDIVLRVVAAKAAARTTSVIRVMTLKPMTISPETPVGTALAVLASKRYMHLPVCGASGEPVGLVDVLALTHAVLQHVNKVQCMPLSMMQLAGASTSAGAGSGGNTALQPPSAAHLTPTFSAGDIWTTRFDSAGSLGYQYPHQSTGENGNAHQPLRGGRFHRQPSVGAGTSGAAGCGVSLFDDYYSCESGSYTDGYMGGSFNAGGGAWPAGTSSVVRPWESASQVESNLCGDRTSGAARSGHEGDKESVAFVNTATMSLKESGISSSQTTGPFLFKVLDPRPSAATGTYVQVSLSEITMIRFRGALGERLGLDGHQMAMWYLDDDGDRCALHTEEDLQNAMRHAQEHGLRRLKIHVALEEDGSASSETNAKAAATPPPSSSTNSSKGGPALQRQDSKFTILESPLPSNERPFDVSQPQPFFVAGVAAAGAAAATVIAFAAVFLLPRIFGAASR